MSFITLSETAAPSTPATGKVVIYANTDGRIVGLTDGGVSNVSAQFVTGSWTPNLRFGGANTNITYTGRYGLYSKIGDMCFIQGAIVLSSKGSATGAADIADLPFLARNTGFAYVPLAIQWENMNGGFVAVGGLVYLNTATFAIHGLAAAGASLAALTDTALTNTTILRFSGAYIV